MRSKRLLTILLALCMVISTLTPAVYAVGTGADTFTVQTPEDAATDSSAVHQAPEGPVTLRNNPLETSEAEENEEADGKWIATPVEGTQAESLVLSEVPACVEELRKAAEFFDANESVAAFVVMEDAPPGRDLPLHYQDPLQG